MASATASRSLMGRRAQTCRLATSRMVAPPCNSHSLEGHNQLFNGDWGQDSRFWAGFRREIRRGDGDEPVLVRKDFDLAMPDVSRQERESSKLENSAKERMSGIGNSDLTFAFLRDQRRIASVGFCPRQVVQRSTRFHHVR